MHLQDLYYHIMMTKEVAVIGREFSAYGMEYALVGLVNTDKGTELVLLECEIVSCSKKIENPHIEEFLI